MEKYGHSQKNPILVENSEVVITILENIVTKNGFHILFQFDSYSINDNSIIEKYEIFTGDEKSLFLFFKTSLSENIWIAPDDFIFQNDYLIYQGNVIHHQQDYLYQEDYSFDEVLQKFDLLDVNILDLFLFENVGFDYKTNNFPENAYQEYLIKHTSFKE